MYWLIVRLQAPGKWEIADVPVIGLAAPAGGLQAFTGFFETMPDTTGLSFVAIHHVDPDHESLMADPSAKHIKMAVALAADQTKIAPDHV